jgi:hypothetical protein
MTHPTISSLNKGDQLGTDETPRCCGAATDKYPSGYQCGACDSFANHDRNRTVTHVHTN